MKIFLTGATGYIGSAVAKALLKGGHEVVGLTHSKAKTAELKAAGLKPAVGDLKKPDSYRAAADACEVLIHAAFEYSGQGPSADRTALETLIASARAAKAGRLLVYTSGVWVLGNHKGLALDEKAPARPVAAVDWRPAHEALALDSAGGRLATVVIRPGCVYGGAGGLYGRMIESATEKGAVRFVGDGSNCWATVYAEDLAQLYRLAVEKRPEREIYHATDGSAEPLRAVAEAFLKVAGGGKAEAWPLEEARQSLGPLADALALDQRVSSVKARQELRWRPNFHSVVKNAAALVDQWRERRGTVKLA